MAYPNDYPGISGAAGPVAGGPSLDPNGALSQLLTALAQRKLQQGPLVVAPGDIYQGIAGGAQNFPGASLGPFNWAPGPMRPQHPFLGAIGEMAANGSLAELLLALMGGPRTSSSTTRRGGQAPVSPNQQASDALDQLYRQRTGGR